MKLNKSILMASALALGFLSGAQAADSVVIRFTGSSAFRSTLHSAIQNSLDSGYTYGYVGSSGLGSAGQAIFKGTISGSAVIIKTSWTGSEAGIYTVGNSSTTNFLDDSATTTSNGTAGLTKGTTAETPDIALSDTLQATSQFSTTATSLTEVSNGAVGIVPFAWVASKNAATMITGSATGTPNITPAHVKALYPNGSIPVAFFTENYTLDKAKLIFAVGRNPFSGTRLSAFAEAGLGATIQGLKQYAPNSANVTGTTNLIVGGTSTIVKLNLWPRETVSGLGTSGDTKTAGNSGYDGGGDLAYALGSSDSSFIVGSTTYAGTGGLLGYVSVSDSGKATAGGARLCTWNGVAYSAPAIEEGAYSFWSQERMYYRNNAASLVSSFAATVAAVARADSTVAVPLASMHVTRTADAGTIGKITGY